MSPEQPLRDRFIHALLSPLTTLQGAASLLQRRLQGHTSDADLAALLAAIERSTMRLRSIADLLLDNATIGEGRIVIDLPLAELPRGGAAPSDETGPAPAQQPYHVLPDGNGDPEAAREAGPLLVIAAPGSAAAAVGAELRARGHQVTVAAHAAEGLDYARALRPALVLLDPEVDRHGEMVLSVLAEDPDTKGLTVALLAPEGRPAGPFQPLIVPEGLAPAQAAEVLSRAVAPGGARREGRPHILIVDDEPEIANLLALQFFDEGFQTTTLHSGTEALRCAREQQFALVLLDVMLPDIDGFTVLGGLRAQPESQLTPIILVSAINSPAEKVRGLQLGADDYITKPFSAPELSARVQAAMRRSEREGGANPSTRLPGNIAIERAISQRIAQGQPFAVCYGDLDNFKAYNDSYGFLKGDAVIQRTAQLLLDAVRLHGNPDDFVGHIGGDDFVVITTPERAAALCEAAARQLDETAPLFYDAEARAHGYISGLDRQGRPTDFPLVSITFAVVSSERRPFKHPGDVAQRAAEAKKRAKLSSDRVYLAAE
jgi:DNA-binding response OmpR family regulator